MFHLSRKKTNSMLWKMWSKSAINEWFFEIFGWNSHSTNFSPSIENIFPIEFMGFCISMRCLDFNTCFIWYANTNSTLHLFTLLDFKQINKLIEYTIPIEMADCDPINGFHLVWLRWFFVIWSTQFAIGFLSFIFSFIAIENEQNQNNFDPFYIKNCVIERFKKCWNVF